MSEAALTFADSEAYERFMGQWSRAAGAPFLEWISAPRGLNWLDVGCGTGVFTELILRHCAPAAVFGVDPHRAQIEHASRHPMRQRALLRVARAEALPYSDEVFDVVASALTINFIADRSRAMTEMRRVARASGTVAAFVWDFGIERSPSGPLRVALRQSGFEVPDMPGTQASRLQALESLFEATGFQDITARVFEVTSAYVNFDAFWDAQTGPYSPTTPMIEAMTASQRDELIDRVRAVLPNGGRGAIEYTARANAVKARR